MGDVADPNSRAGSGDAGPQCSFGRIDQGRALRGHGLADDEADRRIGHDAGVGHGEVERHEVPVGQRGVVRQAVEHGVVDRRADVVTEGAAPEGRCVVDVAGHRPGVDDHALCPPVDVQEVRADRAAALHRLQDLGDEGAGVVGAQQFCAVQDLDHGVPFGWNQ